MALLLGVLLLPVSTAAMPAAASPTEAGSQAASEANADGIAARIRATESMPSNAARSAILRSAAGDAAALANSTDRDTRLWRRLQIDRMYALGLAGDSAGSVQVYDLLLARHFEIPAFAAPGAAQALFALGRGAEGQQLLLAAAAKAPADPGPVIRLAYLLHQDGRVDAARQPLQDWLQGAAGRADVIDADRIAASLALARLDRWNEAFDASASRLAALAVRYPDTAAIRIEQAALQRQRGRPRAALALLGLPGQTDARDADAREVGAQAWLDLQRADRAAALLDSEASSDARARLTAQRASRGELSVAYANTQSPAVASPSGNRESALSLRTDGPLLADAWRIGAQVSQHQADFQGAAPTASYAGVRVTRQDTGGETTLEIGRTFDAFLRRSYALVDAAYWVCDDIRLAARLALNDPEGPLQARANGIGIDSLALSAGWRPSEAWRMDAGVGTAHFDDGNRRSWGSLAGEQRLRANAAAVTSVFGSVYASSNSLRNAPYFNPVRDTTLELGLLQRMTDHRGDIHTLRPSVARYMQDGYAARWIPRLAYALRVPLHAGRWLQWDVGAARPVYDGQRETRWWLSLTYGWNG